MQKKLFKITDYSIYLEKEVVIVDCMNEQETRLVSVTIKIPAFTDFLIFNDKLNWELNLSEAGEHKQTTGQMSMDEYWDCMEYITEDLYEFIVKHPIEFRKKTVENAGQSIADTLNKVS